MPGPGAPDWEISDFALSFDGYGLYALVRSRITDLRDWNPVWEEIDLLDRLRCKLFLEQRAGAWKKLDKTPEERMRCMRGMVERIRSLVLVRETPCVTSPMLPNTPAAPEVRHPLPSDQLTPDRVPGPYATDGEISRFALTFDGYGLEALVRFGSDDPKDWDRKWEQVDLLDRMRDALFFEQRAGHWKNDGKTHEERRFCMRGMVEEIRALLQARSAGETSEVE